MIASSFSPAIGEERIGFFSSDQATFGVLEPGKMHALSKPCAKSFELSGGVEDFAEEVRVEASVPHEVEIRMSSAQASVLASLFLKKLPLLLVTIEKG